MIKRIRSLLLGGETTPESNPVDEQRAVTAALLVHAALMDGHFDDHERAAIMAILVDEFEISLDEVTALISEAEIAVEKSSQLFGFTRKATEHLDHEARIALMEMLWRVVYADGELHDYEDNLMRRIAGLLHVPDRESAFARQRVLGQ